MRNRADLVAFDDHGNPVLAVEIKKKRGTNPNWASAMRENLMSHGYFGRPVHYFLLGLPDVFYLWDHNDRTDPAKQPDYIVNPREVFDDYYFHLINEADHEGLEMILYEWLKRLSTKDIRSLPSFMIESGLYEKLKDAHIRYEVAL